MSATTSIPSGAADVTPEWLTAALRDGGAIADDVSVTEVCSEPIGVGIGLVGALARLHTAYDGGRGPETVIAKFPAAEEGSRFVAAVLGMYRKEVGFYQELSPRTALPHARCYHAAHDADSDAFVLLLEDLADGRVVDQLAGCDRADGEVAVDGLADLHAGFWNDDTLADVDWLTALCDPPFPDAVAMAYDQSWATVQDLFGAELTAEVKAFGDRYTEVLPDLVSRLSEPPFTLSHGDYRLDNFFFGDGRRADLLKVCDWQLVDRSRGGRDLAYFLTQSFTPARRAHLERPLVERYVSRLHSHGVVDYPLDVAWDDYRLATALSFAYPVVAGGSLDHVDERATGLTAEMFRRCVRAMTELDSLSLL